MLSPARSFSTLWTTAPRPLCLWTQPPGPSVCGRSPQAPLSVDTAPRPLCLWTQLPGPSVCGHSPPGSCLWTQPPAPLSVHTAPRPLCLWTQPPGPSVCGHSPPGSSVCGHSPQAHLSVELCRQEYCCGLPCAPPGDLPGSGTGPASPALTGGFFTTSPPGKPQAWCALPNFLLESFS